MSSAPLDGDGCGKIVVRQCYSGGPQNDNAHVGVYIGANLVGSTIPASVSGVKGSQATTVFFTFTNNDVLAIKEEDQIGVAQVISLDFYATGSNECLAAAVSSNAPGVGVDDTAKKANRLARMTSVSPCPQPPSPLICNAALPVGHPASFKISHPAPTRVYVGKGLGAPTPRPSGCLRVTSCMPQYPNSLRRLTLSMSKSATLVSHNKD
jgi:hypothetical protein